MSNRLGEYFEVRFGFRQQTQNLKAHVAVELPQVTDNIPVILMAP